MEGEATSYGAAPEAAGKAGPENGRKIQGFRNCPECLKKPKINH